MAMLLFTSLSRVAILSIFIVTFVTVTFLSHNRGTSYSVRNNGDASRFRIPFSTTATKKPPIDRQDLSDQECRAAFPGLLQNVDEAVAGGKFKFEKSNPEYKGLVQGRIKDGKLYILTFAPDHTPEILIQRTAILSQIHRSLLTSPSPLPSTTFAFTINDSPKNNSWAFARPNKASDYNIWLMPHFGFWAWPPNLGSMEQELEKIAAVEEAWPWEKKIDKAIWRGTPWFNPLGHPHLRQDLLRAAKGKEWADIAPLISATENGTRSNAIPIEEFCKYRYVVYTEGVTYSGRLSYHQACGSVLLMAPLTWVTSTARLVRPVVAEELVRVVEGGGRPAFNGPPTPSTSSAVRPLLPTLKPEYWKMANAIYVRPDFSNLEETVLFLRKHPEVARRIARNQNEVMIGGRYLSGAAETCHWRALIRGWASSAVVDEREWGEEVGERFESWILKEVVRRERGGRP